MVISKYKRVFIVDFDAISCQGYYEPGPECVQLYSQMKLEDHSPSCLNYSIFSALWYRPHKAIIMQISSLERAYVFL
jgi:hypothetical protein